jgi:hypothetical protein
MSFVEDYNKELYHYGVPGMKWGRRKAKQRSLYDRITGADKYYDQIMKTPMKKSKTSKTSANTTPKATSNVSQASAKKNQVKSAKKTTAKGKAKTNKALQKIGNQPVKKTSGLTKTGMSMVQAMYKNPMAETARQTANYVTLASQMSPEYLRRFNVY